MAAVARLAASMLVAGALATAGARVGDAARALSRGRALAARTLRFELEGEAGRPALLALGDSLAVGVGAARSEDSLPGRLAAQHPGITVHNRARNGARMRDLVEQLHSAPRARYDVVLAAAGANDVLHGTDADKLDHALQAFLAAARVRGSLVIMLNSANVGGAPILPWYLRRIFTTRSRKLRNATAAACDRAAVCFVDLFAEPRDDLFGRDPRRYYGADGLHPTSESYRVCHERVRAAAPVDAVLSGSV